MQLDNLIYNKPKLLNIKFNNEGLFLLKKYLKNVKM